MAGKQGKSKSRKKNSGGGISPSLLERLEGLIDELAGLRYEEDQERFDDIVAELVNFGEVLGARLRAMSESISYQERRAAVEAIGQLDFEERESILMVRLKDANWKVRRSAALAIAQRPMAQALETLLTLAEDPHRELRLTVLEALGRLGLAEAAEVLEETLQDSDWRVRQEAAIALGRLGAVRSFGPLMSGLTDEDEDVQFACAASMKAMIDEVSAAALRGHIEAREIKERRAMLQAFQKEVLAEGLDPLHKELQRFVSVQVDVGEISQFGRVLTSTDQIDGLDRAFERERVVEDLLKVLTKEGNRSVILVGEAGVGKTAIIHEVSRRLAEKDPTCAVLETSTPELMVGTKYIGEWETKLHDLVEKIRAPRRVILYLTNVNDLPGAGTTSSNKQNFVTLLAPYIRRGDITVIGESTAEALRRGIEKDLSVKRLFQNVHVGEPDLPTTHQTVRQCLGELGRRHGATLEASPEVLELLIDLSGTYYSTVAQPGRSITVLKQVVDHLLEGRAEGQEVLRVEAEDVIKGLARFTGLPELLLNDEVPLDPAAVRSFFEHRVLGQPEAVDAIVDLITLIKAGLTDPTKPFGVFLFVGPTGVGKTEMAKVLAEFIFGSAKRLLRLDLSEYRDYESFEKLIGGTWRHREEGRLTGKVREQPFSVILLDEIEKAHSNIFDLFLQVFDDGRLTDAQGRKADFRHTIIIMTSNLASAFSPGGPLGFGGDEGDSLASAQGVLREVSRFFRPEFLNRIDRMVVFKPLDKAIMRKIAQRELGKVLMRSGLLRRKLVVDIQPTVVDYLMAQGFSQAFGARPLKRAVEKKVLLPVAREIVQKGPGYAGDMLRVRATTPEGQREGRVEVDRASTELEARRQALIDDGVEGLSGTGLEELTPSPRTRKQARARLVIANERLDDLLVWHPPEALQKALVDAEKETSDVTFWDDAERARLRLVQLAHKQRLHETLETLRGRRDELQRTLAKGSGVRLRDWHPRFVAWLVDVHLTEELALQMNPAQPDGEQL